MSSQRTAHLSRVTTSPNASPSKMVHAVKRRRSVPNIATDTSLNVISRLKMPSHPVQVAIDFDNQKNPNVDVQAYAKVAGATWTYYVKSLKVVIGRLSESADEQHQTIDIDLGPAKVVSRRHAIIQYNQLASVWEVVIIGRNGVKVNGRTWREGAVRLASGSIIEIGGAQMMFVLPDDSTSNITVADMTSDEELEEDRHRDDLSDATDALSSVHRRANHLRNGSEAESPDKHKSTIRLSSSLPHHPSYPKGLKMVSQPAVGGQGSVEGLTLAAQQLVPEVQDLSSDDCKDIKPPYSYATMITQAILSAPDGSMTLAGIYDYIASHYSYYRFSRTGWQNSIRHNLSLNKAFEKVPRRPDEPGKGMKWQVLPSYRNDYLRRARDGELTKRRTCDWDSRQHQPRSRNNSLSPSRKRTLEDSEPEMKTEQSSSNTGPTSLLAAAAAAAGNRTPERSATLNGKTPERDGQQLTSSVLGSRHKRDMGDGESLTATPSPYHMYNPIGAIEAFTPDRGGAAAASSSSVNAGILHTGGRSNLMSNSAQPPSQNSMMAIPSSFGNLSQTPMPQLSNPLLGPPSSTGQHLLPSSYIPASSPAQFWKYMHLSSTPARPPGNGNGNGEFSPANKFSSPPILTPPLQMYQHDQNHQQHYFIGGNIDEGQSEGAPNNNSMPTPSNYNSGDRSIQRPTRTKSQDESIGDLQGVDLIRGFQRIGKTPTDEFSGMRSSPMVQLSQQQQQQQQQPAVRDQENGGESIRESPTRNKSK